MLLIRFPDGEAEFSSGSAPAVGDTLTRRGQVWAVARVVSDEAGCLAVTVMPAEVQRDPSWPEPYQFIRA
jgi:hypothetical protein